VHFETGELAFESVGVHPDHHRNEPRVRLVAEQVTGKSWHTSFMSKDKQKREKKKPKKGKLSSK